MTVTNNRPSQALTASAAWKHPSGRESAFGKYLDIEAQKRMAAALAPGKGMASPYLQFKEDYNNWKAQQPEWVLPDSHRRTEDGLAFLRKHYAGDLSACEIYDALRTMEAMGFINWKEMSYAAVGPWITISMEEMRNGCIRVETSDERAEWLRGFDKLSMTGFHCLDDILAWLEAFRAEEHPDAVTFEETYTKISEKAEKVRF